MDNPPDFYPSVFPSILTEFGDALSVSGVKTAIMGSKETRQKRDFNSEVVPDIENNYERSIKLGIHEAKTSRRFFKNQPRNDLSERRQKAGFLGPISFKITVTKKKNSIKRKSEVEERRKKEKSNCYSLSFYNGFFGDSFWPKKNVGRKRSICR